MRVDWTLRAVEHLESIYEYIAESSPETARRFVSRLIAAPDSWRAFLSPVDRYRNSPKPTCVKWCKTATAFCIASRVIVW